MYILLDDGLNNMKTENIAIYKKFGSQNNYEIFTPSLREWLEYKQSTLSERASKSTLIAAIYFLKLWGNYKPIVEVYGPSKVKTRN